MKHYFYKIIRENTFSPVEVIKLGQVSSKIKEVAAYKTDQNNRFLVIRAESDLSEAEIANLNSRISAVVAEYATVEGKEQEFEDVKFKRIDGKYKYFFYPNVHTEMA